MRALLVEDNPVLADGVSRAFALAGLTLDHASDLSSARAFLREFRVDIVLLDLTLPDGDGMTLLGFHDVKSIPICLKRQPVSNKVYQSAFLTLRKCLW